MSRSHPYTVSAEGKISDADIDILYGNTVFGKEGTATHVEAAARKGVKGISLGLDGLFFGCLFTHEQRIASLRVDEWEAILRSIDRRTAKYPRIFKSYDYIAEYAKSRYDTKITEATLRFRLPRDTAEAERPVHAAAEGICVRRGRSGISVPGDSGIRGQAGSGLEGERMTEGPRLDPAWLMLESVAGTCRRKVKVFVEPDNLHVLAHRQFAKADSTFSRSATMTIARWSKSRYFFATRNTSSPLTALIRGM